MFNNNLNSWRLYLSTLGDYKLLFFNDAKRSIQGLQTPFKKQIAMI